MRATSLSQLLALACLPAQMTTAYILPTGHANEQQQHVLGPSPLGHPILPARHRRPSPFSSSSSDQQQFQAGFVALGDSYSAGIGTGFHGQEDACRHGLGAYPRLIADDLARSQHGPANDSITCAQLLSCTGATAQQVLATPHGDRPGEGKDEDNDSQLDKLNTTLPLDFAMLSLGGNDLGFFDVMNACVFRFYSFYSGTCEAALARSRAALEDNNGGSDFALKLEMAATEILDAARWEKKPWFFITMTGYARFFDADTPECDDMSFGVWLGGGWRRPKLTRELRGQMNALVVAVNAKIRDTVAVVNAKFSTDKILFVDHDELWDGHRFCEPGVAEPDYAREDTWFFLVGGSDNALRNDTNTGTGDDNDGERLLTSAEASLVDPDSCLEPARRSGDWGAQALCYMAMAKKRDSTLRPAPALGRAGRLSTATTEDGVSAENSMWYVPTYYGKTFHPRTRGHEAIRDAVYAAWRRMDEDGGL